MKKDVSLNEAYSLLHPRPVALICTKDRNGKVNVMSCAWITPVSDEPPLIAISLWAKGYTHNIIDETKEFTVNIPSSKLMKQVWLAGTKSGSKVDKTKILNLKFSPSKTISPPLIEECIGFLECKVKERLILNEQILYIAEIQRACAEEDLFKNGIWIDEANILLHTGGKIFSTPKSI
ncbi:MAG: flavin reductase family protein [Nitrososphaeria archaeon]|nr:flavin reductase family protein [Nitrososphaeria archaeon]